MKVVSIVGARPQFIKAASVSRVLRDESGIREVLVHTGQHYDSKMSDIFFREMGIPMPQYNLGVGSSTHGAQTARMLAGIEEVLTQELPDWVITFGDTNSTLAGVLAAVKLHIPVAHIEAGLRSFNRQMPEEINRVIADHVSDLLLAPTEAAVINLREEGLCDDRVRRVGDVMYDAVLHYAAIAESKSTILEHLAIKPQGYILATIHRVENTDNASNLAAIFSGLERVSKILEVVLPIHPRTREALSRFGLTNITSDRFYLIEPVGYLDMVKLERNARAIVTDSGGVQKEAFFHRVPCVTLRSETEWVELVKLGWNHLVPPSTAEAVENGITQGLYSSRGPEEQPFGDGKAAQKIVQALKEMSKCVL